MEKKARFQIGDKVVNKVSKRGSYEPSILSPFSIIEVEKVEKMNDDFLYTCEYDGYKFSENELFSLQEYKETL